MKPKIEEHQISIGRHSLTQVSLCKILSKVIECVLFDLQQISCLPVPVDADIFPTMDKKMKACFDSILDLQSGLADVDFTKVENIVLLFGASPTVPRVVFEIRFSPALLNSAASADNGSIVGFESDKENVNETAAVQHFFHNFIQCDLCGALTLPATKMFLFLKAPRCSEQKWLVPKLHFSISKAAKIHKRLTITSNWLTPGCPGTLRKSSTEILAAKQPSPDSLKNNEDDASNVWYSAPMSIPGYAF